VGGVACNRLLRQTFKNTFERVHRTGAGSTPVCVYYPSPILTTDNGAMIAAAGTPKLRNPEPLDLELNASADLRLC
jgi:N6-L-threonylcarbamoyladenine synthase